MEESGRCNRKWSLRQPAMRKNPVGLLLWIMGSTVAAPAGSGGQRSSEGTDVWFPDVVAVLR